MSFSGMIMSHRIYCDTCRGFSPHVSCCQVCSQLFCCLCAGPHNGICKACSRSRNYDNVSAIQKVPRSSSNPDKSKQTTSLKVAVTEKYCQTEPNESLRAVCVINSQKNEITALKSENKKLLDILNCLEKEKNDLENKLGSITSQQGRDSVSRQPSLQSANQTLQDLKELFLSQVDCDVTLKVQGKEFQAHKAILVARSPVFASTFRSNMIEKASGVVDIEDCDPSCFADFLCFLYCGEAENITTENVYSLFMAADKYQVQDLRLECLEFMKNNLSIDTFCETITLALLHLEQKLTDISINFFARHWQEIIVTAKWQSFVIDYPVQSNEIMIKALLHKKE